MAAKKNKFSTENGREIKALIVGGGDFLRAVLARRLSEKGARVVFGEDFSKENSVGQLDYIFYCFKQGEFFQDLKKRPEPEFLEKIKGVKFIFLSPIYNFSKTALVDFRNYWEKKKIDARLILFTNLYGPGMDFAEETVFNSFLRFALEGDLRVFGEGLEKCYPTFIDDFLEGVFRATFYQDTSGRVFYLISARDLAIVRLAYFLQERIMPGKPEVKFIDRGGRKRPPLNKELLMEGARELYWEAKTDLGEGMAKTFAWYAEKRGKLRKEQVLVEKSGAKVLRKRFFRLERVKKTISSYKIFFIFLLLLLVLLLPFLRLGWYLFWGVRDLRQGSELLRIGSFDRAEKKTMRAFGHLSLAKRQLGTSWVLETLPFDDYRYRAERVLGVGIDISQAARHFVLAGKFLQEAWQMVFSEYAGDGDLAVLLGKGGRELEVVYEKLSFIEGNLRSFEEENLPGGKEVLAIRKDLPVTRQKVALFSQLLPVLDEALGREGKKTYMVLFQNNMELRPTGGFIGSYALLTFEKGKFVDLKVEDVFAADGQLKGHVEPPRPIRLYLNEANWWLRDSNWHPDFPQSAHNATWFLEKEMKTKVNGVVGINLFAVENILRATGPIWLADYEEEITADNLFVKAEYYAEKDFFPGSTQKRDFLGSLAAQLFEEIRAMEVEEVASLGQSLLKSFDERQILVSLDEVEVMNLISAYGWDGSMRSSSCQQVFLDEKERVGCLADYLFFVEANLGVNKANYFLKRRVEQEVKIEESGVERSLSIFYENTSPDESWPGGVYKNYLRVIVPKEAQVLEVMLDTAQVEVEKIDREELDDKNAFGFLVMVPVKEERKVTFKYRLPFNESGDRLNYFLLVQKQSGMGADRMEVAVRVPASWQVTRISPPGLTGRQVIVYNTDLSKDRVFKIELEKGK